MHGHLVENTGDRTRVETLALDNRNIFAHECHRMTVAASGRRAPCGATGLRRGFVAVVGPADMPVGPLRVGEQPSRRGVQILHPLEVGVEIPTDGVCAPGIGYVAPMVRGRQNSSLTRVRPFFQALFSADPTGASWLPALLAACPHADRLPETVRTAPGPLWHTTTERRRYKGRILGRSIELERAFEHKVDPPTRFLEHLLAHPSASRWPIKKGERKGFGEETQRLREALVDGPEDARAATIAEGLSLLQRRGASNSAREWWAFEGSTEVDCCLETDDLVIFVEGKRNELLSESTDWFVGRNQLVRNLEVLGEIAGDRACAMLVASEHPFADPGPGVYDAGLPHLTPSERGRVRDRYLGQVTWRALCEGTGVPFGSLPDER